VVLADHGVVGSNRASRRSAPTPPIPSSPMRLLSAHRLESVQRA
jgi:hypothetical protein